MTDDKVLQLVIECIKPYGAGIPCEALLDPGPDTRLYGGREGTLDSVALVSLIVDLEDRIASEFGRDVVLADEKAMSQAISPFRRVSTLAAHITRLLGEQRR